MTGPAQIPWREALKSCDRIRDSGGLIFCGDAIVTWQPCEIRKAIAALREKQREQKEQQR